MSVALSLIMVLIIFMLLFLDKIIEYLYPRGLLANSDREFSNVLSDYELNSLSINSNIKE